MQKTSVRDITSWIENINNGLTGGACFAPNFLKPYHFVTLALELKRYQEKDLQIPDELANYAATMGLWDAIELPSPVPLSKNKRATTFLPIEPLKTLHTVQNSAEKIMGILKSHCVDKNTAESLSCMLLELLENCFAHAAIETGLHGLVCAQPWSNGKLAQIALVDSGIGIRNSLGQNPELRSRLDGENCCELATQYGITGKPEKGHTGYGLTLARDLIEQNGGNLIIISKSELFQSCEKKGQKQYCELPWHGTLIIMELNTDRALDSADVFNKWPLPKGYTNEDFDD